MKFFFYFKLNQITLKSEKNEFAIDKRMKNESNEID